MATQPSQTPERPSAASIILNISVAVILFSTAVFVFQKLKSHVASNLASPALPPRIILKNIPNWMTDDLARSIANSAQPAGLRSALDQEVLKEIVASLRKNPWVRDVRQVKRVFGDSAGDTLQIDAEYRVPIALVSTSAEMVLVATDAVRLPEAFPAAAPPNWLIAPGGRTAIRIIDGVASPAPKPGEVWRGEDLAAGLDLAKTLFNRADVDEVRRIDVANFASRRSRAEPQIVLITHRDTRIHWGEPLRLAFHAEIPPAQKLQRLSDLKRKFGRLDAGRPWIDIRLDKVTLPAPEGALTEARTTRPE